MWYNITKGGVFMAIKIESKSINGQKNKISPQERSVLKRYGVIKQIENKRKARTINELYEQRYKTKHY